MAVIVPFRGLRYNSEKIESLADLIIPPYDVITPAEQEQFYGRSPHNFIRLEYGRTEPGDGDTANRYTRAAASLQRWLERKILLLEDERSFYLYRQRFAFGDSVYRRTGLIAALRLEPYSRRVVLPHENTLASPKADRLELLRLCRANFSPIFGLFADPEQRFREICAPLLAEKPLYDFTDHRGEGHTIWAVAGAQPREALARLMAPRQVFIADGHHRYDTALGYSQEAGPGGGPGSGHVLGVLVPLEDPGLLILPFHRLLRGLTAGQLASLLENVERHFLVAEGPPPERGVTAMDAPGAPDLELLLPGRELLLRAREKQAPQELDVSLLKRLLLDPLFDGAAAERHLDFTTGEEEARRAVTSGEAQAAFLLRPTPVEAVTARALQGENMPQKSTCFHPKLPAGLVIHHHDWSY